MSGVILTDEQQAIADDSLASLRRYDTEAFTFHGLAGTGKTTVLAHIARQLPNATLVTLTGKAASVLRAKTGLDVKTIHSVFYSLTGKTVNENGRDELHCGANKGSGALAGHTVLLDECSMVGEEHARDILRTGARIIACGDPGQLPPVRGQQYFSRPDAVLQTIHRQALESPIIRQAHRVRAGKRYESDGENFQIIEADDVTSDLLCSVDAVLCWRNNTRHALNRRLRKERGIIPASHPRAGEPVMCLRNSRQFGLYNGVIYTLRADFQPWLGSSISLEINGETRTIPDVEFEGYGFDSDYGEEPTSKFDYGYAMTVHKSQGSEWDHVMLLDEYDRYDDRKQWLYTGITRAKQKITIVKV